MSKNPYKLAKLYYDFLKNKINNKDNKLLNKNYFDEVYVNILSHIENLEDKTELKESYNRGVVNKFLTLIYTDLYTPNVFKNDFFNKIYNNEKIVKFLNDNKYEESYLNFFDFRDKLTPLNLDNLKKCFIQNTLILRESFSLDLKEQDRILFSILTSLSKENTNLESYDINIVNKVTNKKNIDYLFNRKNETIILLEKILNKNFSSVDSNTIKPQLIFLLNLFKPQNKTLLNRYLSKKRTTFYLDYYLLFDKNENNHTEQITNYLKRIIEEKSDRFKYEPKSGKVDFKINTNGYLFEYLTSKLKQKYIKTHPDFNFDVFLKRKMHLLTNLLEINKTNEGKYEDLIRSFDLLDDDKDLFKSFNKEFFELVKFLCFEKGNDIDLISFKDFFYTYKNYIENLNNSHEWGNSVVDDTKFYLSKGIQEYVGFLELILENVDLCEYLHKNDKDMFENIGLSLIYFFEDMKKREDCIFKEKKMFITNEQFYIVISKDEKKINSKSEDFKNSYIFLLNNLRSFKKNNDGVHYLRGIGQLNRSLETIIPYLNLKNSPTQSKIPNIKNFYVPNDEELLVNDNKLIKSGVKKQRISF